MINTFLMQAGDLMPPWSVGVCLTAAALSFLCRWWAQTRYGRIREYGPRSLGVAVALIGLAILYLFIAVGMATLLGHLVAIRILLALLSLALVGFNWGGVRAVAHDIGRRQRGEHADE